MKKGARLLSCMLIATTLCTATACRFDKKIVSVEASKGYIRKATAQGSVTTEFQQKTAAFSLETFKKCVDKQSGKYLVSPLSATLCLALINNGASGNTRAQIEKAIGMPTEQLNQAMYAYTSS